MTNRTVAIIGTRGYPSYYSGFETAVRHIAPYLADRGWAVRVYSRPDFVHLDDLERDSRVRTVFTWGRESKSLSTLSYGMTACFDIFRHPVDVALVMNVANGYWLPILRRRGIPILTNVDGIEWDRAKWGRLAKRVFYTGAKLSAHFSTGLVFDAAAIANRWRREFKRDGVIIPYGGEPPVEELPVEPGLTHRGYALFVARFVPENTVFEFLMAAEVLCQQYDVVMVGSSGYGGEIDAKVADLAKTNSRFHWFGHISDDRRLDSLWQHAGAYFHGHSVGGTNPSLVQAMACGAPIVARDTVFTREVLDDCAIFIPPQIEAIRSAIAQLLTDSDRQKSLSDRAQARARTHYTWEQVNEGYASALRDLVSGSFVKS